MFFMKSNEQERYVTICPRCGSKDIIIEQDAIYAATGLINQFKQCQGCGFHGSMFPQVKSSEAPKRPRKVKELPKAEIAQTSFGKGYYKYILYISMPLIIVLIILRFL